MISATRRWLKRNRTPFAIGFGVVGVSYVATKYLLGTLSESRKRTNSDRIARENLRRRFEQNQEDCTLTTLVLLSTAADNIIGELQTERITFELQQKKAANQARNGDGPPSDFGSSPPSVTDDDERSMVSFQSESGIHASQMGVPSPSAAGEGPQDGAQRGQKSRSKARLWNDLKISAITRSFALIYILALITLFTRIQLNLLGRRSYLSSVVSLATGGVEQTPISLENNDDDNPDQAYGEDFEANRRYLTFCWWILHRGWREVMLKVKTAVKEVFGPLHPRDDLSLQRFSELTLEVRKKVEGATESDRKEGNWLQFLLPPRDQEDYLMEKSGMTTELSLSTGQTLRRLLDETADLIDSPPFSHVLTLLLDAGFSTLVEKKIAQRHFEMPGTTDTLDIDGPRLTEVIDLKPVKLPSLLATVTRQAHSIGHGCPNEYLQAMDRVKDLEAFAAVIYSSNWENDISPANHTETSMVFVKQDEPGQLMVSPVNNPESSMVLVKEDHPAKLMTMPATESSGHESVVDLGTASTFESAWGKAVDTVNAGALAS
ncbi:Peroxin-3 family protein [Diplocarpon rosae]|nr:Peroxin-3 family protein [Diplocarpon rosae]